MKTIYKYGLVVDDNTSVNLPIGAQILDIQSSGKPGLLNLWAIVDPEASITGRLFHVRGTGHELGNVGSYLATVQDGPFVWHIFQAVT